ncbi:MAG TPA: pyruvate dehydrogenase (acetyl-transferring) E1 component subunit alpha, partial [Thermoleophilaceae bacterium]|nr:pyruvate dehydrogenase (acetyl-transferring) E1 component subunit alpha [Thermoleophilaceae bacterium]
RQAGEMAQGANPVGGDSDGVTSDEVALEERSEQDRNPVGGGEPGEAQARAAEAELRARGEIPGDGAPRTLPEDVGADHPLPEADTARKILERMMLIRRFEERAGEMYAKAKIGGFLHLCIGEEATIVGAIDALRDGDYLLSTYREHGQALARGTPANAVMAELFGRVDGCSSGRGGSMHLFDFERRFLGGYGIVGGNLPLAAGVALACDYKETDDAVLCMFGDGASNQGTFGETMNLAALWDLPVVFMVINNQFGMGTALERHSAVTDLSQKSGGFGVPGSRCNGMDVLDVHACVQEALRKAREERRPQLVEAVTYRYRGHSMADPEEYRTKEEVEEWRRHDPIVTFRSRLEDEGVVSEEDAEKLDEQAVETVDEAVEFADNSPFPELDSLYDDIYVYGEQVRGWHTVDERSPDVHPGEQERDAPEVSHDLAEAGAAYAKVGDAKERARRGNDDDGEGEGEAADEERDEEGGGD